METVADGASAPVWSASDRLYTYGQAPGIADFSGRWRAATLRVEVDMKASPDLRTRDGNPAQLPCPAMSILRSIVLFALAAVAEIGGAWMVWQGVREHRGIAWIGAGIAALAAYGFVATFQDDPNFGRILAAYGGIFVAGSLAWGMAFDGFRPDRYDITGALICLAGVGVIMYAPRPA